MAKKKTLNSIPLILLGTHLIAGLIGAIAVDNYQRPAPTPVETPTAIPHPTATADEHGPLTVDNCLIRFNEARLRDKQKQVADTPSINRIAQGRAEEMASGASPLGHDGFRSLIDKGVVSESNTGELVTTAKTCTEAVTNLLGSPTHADGLADPRMREIGIGISKNVVVFIYKINL